MSKNGGEACEFIKAQPLLFSVSNAAAKEMVDQAYFILIVLFGIMSIYIVKPKNSDNSEDKHNNAIK